MSAQGEDAFVQQLRARLGTDGAALGDDAACLPWSHPDVVLAKDVIVDGRHFDLRRDGLAAAVYKAVAINLSDLAAVAALPDAFLLGVVLPTTAAQTLTEALPDALAAAARTLGVPCVGGDTNVAPGPLVLSVTAVGHAGPHGFVSRAGARAGDVLSVTGPLGGSRQGRHLRPQPRITEAQVLAQTGQVHAMIDLSDGLSSDARRLCAASGVGATIRGRDVPVHDDVDATDERERVRHALDDGEDFELLVAHTPFDASARSALRTAGVTLHELGRCGTPQSGLLLGWGDDDIRPLVPGGFDHLA